MRFTIACLTFAWIGYVSAQDIPVNVATTIQLSTFGVSVDAQGELTVKTFADPTGRLTAERRAAARARLPADLAARSELRKVSLTAIERAVGRDGQRLGRPQLASVFG